MAWRMGMLIAYDGVGEVRQTLDYLVVHDVNGNPLGMADFAAHEDAGDLLAVWEVPGAVGSGMWPQWIDVRQHRVEVVRGRIAALVHKPSATTTTRDEVLGEIETRLKGGGEVDLRDVVGGPGRPLLVSSMGRAYRQASAVPDDPNVIVRGRPARADRLG